MNFFSAVLLGILQGLTEFLPVSSSGHLVLAQHFFGVQDTGILFEVFMHLGTLLAVIVFFRKKLWHLIESLFHWKKTLRSQVHRANRNIVLYLAVATIATGIVYLLFGDLFESFYDKPVLVAAMLAISGVIVFISDYITGGGIPAMNMGLPRSFMVGLIQGVAIIPGISRSGSTIAGSLFTGLRRRDAAEFSFLLSIPAILGANISDFAQFRALSWSQFGVYLGGFIASFAVGYLVIGFLLNLIAKARLKYFAYYCWAVSAISLVYMLWIR
jgi:undecaprenyl-diphosphatase